MGAQLIVGGAGFIGTQLIKRIGPEDVTVFDNLSPVVHNRKSLAAATNSGADLIVGDVTSAFDVDSLLDDVVPETLFYLAAETGTGRSLENVTLNARVNTLGLATLLDGISARKSFPKRIVLTSTRAVYGEGPYRNLETGEIVYPGQRTGEQLEKKRFDFEGLEPLSEQAAIHAPKPVNIYGSTKLSQENLLTNWATAFEVPLHIFRLQNVYGAGQSLTNPYTGVLIFFVKQALAGKPIPIYENGGITRDWVHVDDVAALLAAASDGSNPTGVFDCGGGDRLDLESTAELICELCGSTAGFELTPQYRLGDVRHAHADIAPTMKAFGWKPEMSLRDGLTGLIEFVKAGAS